MQNTTRHAPLAGLRIVEVSAFIAAPLGAMTLAQLGAEVIRIDPIGGNIDYRRWPLAANGNSIYWASLNKSKQSVTLALDTPEGQELASAIMCAPGEGAGIVLTNLPAKGWMSYEALSKRRTDLIMMRLTGNFDGSAAVDYTVNCASGFPIATGSDRAPVNHVLPAWDIAAGLYLSTGVLSAERVRSREGCGQEVTLALSDVMLATVGNLGYIGDVQVNGVSREPIGNHLYGAFGRNFATSDGREVMVAAISNRQWKALGCATALAERFEMIGPLMDVDLSTEGGRFHARRAIAAVLEPWFAARTVNEVSERFDGSGVLWGVYRDFRQLVEEDPRCSVENPMFEQVDHPGIGRVLTPRTPLSFAGTQAPRAAIAPTLGEDTRGVLEGLLGLTPAKVDELRERGIVGQA
ncbi:mesaconyl-CoA C1-C4 CoA transferase [Paraburkholderia sp. BL27I4N3]|uniref:CoA transferase n=1 Tax=Paraburkholderia sp. BL27I4N3 TaxID=1938805 RepID=UPI000E267203|nr:CoA transferase [Paraburkholderia sp. BL27I4N3]REE07405.1 mesaconyl-CoA C1-C4 CoA transferase [Paraburkholderia sp. BL27I4N3]